MKTFFSRLNSPFYGNCFLAVSCDNAAGGGSSKDLTDEQLYDLMLLEEYLDFYIADGRHT